MENKKLRYEILKAIEKNSKLSAEDLGAMLGVAPETISTEIKALLFYLCSTSQALLL